MLAGEIRPGEFQGMAALDAWTYEDLKADIQENGVEVPIVVNQAWPCDDRQAVGRLMPDPSNRLLEPPAVSLQPGGVPSSWPDG